MKPISRRSVLTMGGLGLVSTAVGGTGLWRQLNPSLLDPAVGEACTEPEVLGRQGGGLQVRLGAALGTHDVAGREVQTMGYNGAFPGPPCDCVPATPCGFQRRVLCGVVGHLVGLSGPQRVHHVSQGAALWSRSRGHSLSVSTSWPNAIIR